MKTLSGIGMLLSFLLLFGTCKTKNKEQNNQQAILTNKIKIINSIQHKIQLAAGNNFTARPTLNAGEYYYDERNFRDSFGRLKEYVVIERRDTGDVLTNYYYKDSQLIKVTKSVVTLNVNQFANYYFDNYSLIHSHVGGSLSLISTDTLLSRGYRYLSIKGDVGDKEYRKYFGKKTYPPNSIVEIIE